MKDLFVAPAVVFFTPAFSVTCIGEIFVHLSTCYLNGCLTAKGQFFMLLAEEMTNK